MADQVITLTIPEAKTVLALKGFLALYPNTELTDFDIEDDTPQEALYTDGQWIREKIKRNIIRDIKRGLTIARDKEVSAIEDATGIIT